jgi:hypothetical protein
MIVRSECLTISLITPIPGTETNSLESGEIHFI